MNRAHIVLPLLAALCACQSERHDREESFAGPATVNASAARSDRTEHRTKLSSDDEKFIEKAALESLFAVQSSRLAQLEDISREALEFAQMMVDDHGCELDLIARGKGFVPPTRLDSTHQRELDDLAKLDGLDFERRYRAMQAAAHGDAIDLYERGATKVDDPELRAFIQRNQKKLREHGQQLMKPIRPR
jgi:putative membrane protein